MDQRREGVHHYTEQEQRREDQCRKDRHEAIEREARIEARFASSCQSLPPTRTPASS